MTNWLWTCTEVIEPQLLSVSTWSGGKTGIGTLKFYLKTCSYTKQASRRRMQYSKWDLRTWLWWSPKKNSWHILAFQKNRHLSCVCLLSSYRLLPYKATSEFRNSRRRYRQDRKQPLPSSEPDGLDFVMESVETFCQTTTPLHNAGRTDHQNNSVY